MQSNSMEMTSQDWGWVAVNIGMGIGAGIVGLWTFLLAVLIAYPALYQFQRLFINTLVEARQATDYPATISEYLGDRWGVGLGFLYFLMLVIWLFVYSETVTNDSASYLQTAGVTEGLLSANPFYGLAIVAFLVLVAFASKTLLLNLMWRYRKMITPDGRSIYDGGQLAADFGAGTRRILDYAFAMLDALDIRFGPAHAEIMLTPEGPVLIECGARPMGASYPQELLKESVGHTQLELAVEAALEPDRFLENIAAPYALRKHFCIKCLVSARQGSLEATPAVTLLAGLPSARSGNFLHCLESDHLDQTVDLLSSPATLFLCHEDPAVVREDHELITALESEGQNLLFEFCARDGMHPDPDWFQRIPDELWLRPESDGAADAEMVRRVLSLEPGQDVLDCPCGDARFGQHLVRHGVNYAGVDLNPRFIERARRRFAEQGLTGEFTVGDMRELTFTDRFDVVINWFNSFGYFDVETDFLVLRNLSTALRPGGMLLIEAPNRGDVIANTTPKFDAQGKELQRLWDDIGERMYLPIPVEENGRIAHVLTGPRLYSLAQYRLFFRLAELEFAAVYDERLGTYSEASKRMILLARKPE